MSDQVAGYWGYELIETDYTCERCKGTGELPREEVELSELAEHATELLNDDSLDAEESRKRLDEFLGGLEAEPERLDAELQKLAEQTTELVERHGDGSDAVLEYEPSDEDEEA